MRNPPWSLTDMPPSLQEQRAPVARYPAWAYGPKDEPASGQQLRAPGAVLLEFWVGGAVRRVDGVSWMGAGWHGREHANLAGNCALSGGVPDPPRAEFGALYVGALPINKHLPHIRVDGQRPTHVMIYSDKVACREWLRDPSLAEASHVTLLAGVLACLVVLTPCSPACPVLPCPAHVAVMHMHAA
jgi:hypothetical protein